MITRTVLVIGLAISMIACGSAEKDTAEEQGAADEIAGENPVEATVFDPLVDAMKKAEGVQKTVDEQKAEWDKVLEEAENGAGDGDGDGET